MAIEVNSLRFVDNWWESLTIIPYVWHLSKSLTYFIFNFHLDVSVSGCLSEVSSTKVAGDKKRRYFNLSIENDDTLH